MSIRRILIGLSLLCLALSCTKKSDDPAGSSQDAMAAAIDSVEAQLDEIGNLLPNPSAYPMKAPSDGIIHPTSAFGAAWDTTTYFSNPSCSSSCTSDTTVKGWLGYQFSPAAVRDNGSSINVFGRFDSAMGIGCAVLVVLPRDSDGNTTVGSHTITFDSATKSSIITNCGMSADNLPDGASFSAVVTTPSDTTHFDRKYVFSLPADMGGSTQAFYFRNSSTATNISTSENGSNDSATLVFMNKETMTLRVEYFSKGSSGGMQYHRLFYDKTNDLGMVASYEGDASSATITANNQIRYVVVGKPQTASATVAVSFDFDGYNNSAMDFGFNRDACVDPSTGDIGTDGSLACTVTGTSTDDGNLLTVFGNIHVTANGCNATSTECFPLTETTAPNFTSSSNFFTSNATW